MKNIELETTYKGLTEVTGLETSLPIKAGFKIIQNRRKIADEYEAYMEMKNAIVKKYATDGKEAVEPKDEHYMDCLKDVNELMKEEADIELKKIKLSDIENYELPMKAIQALSCMIEEE